MIDLTDSFPEGVKIFKKDNFRRKPQNQNSLLVQCSFSVSESEKFTGETPN